MTTRPERPSETELLHQLNQARIKVPIGTTWRHRKGDNYIVLDHLIDVFDGQVQVVYINAKATGPYVIRWTRKLDMWLELVDGKPRFELV